MSSTLCSQKQLKSYWCSEKYVPLALKIISTSTGKMDLTSSFQTLIQLTCGMVCQINWNDCLKLCVWLYSPNLIIWHTRQSWCFPAGFASSKHWWNNPVPTASHSEQRFCGVMAVNELIEHYQLWFFLPIIILIIFFKIVGRDFFPNLTFSCCQGQVREQSSNNYPGLFVLVVIVSGKIFFC